MTLKRFLIGVIDDGSVIYGPEIMEAIDAFNDKLRANNHWIFAWGLHAPERSHVIDNRNDLGLDTQGPLVPYKHGNEFISGVWIIEAQSEENARQLAAEGSKACNRKVELRPFH